MHRLSSYTRFYNSSSHDDLTTSQESLLHGADDCTTSESNSVKVRYLMRYILRPNRNSKLYSYHQRTADETKSSPSKLASMWKRFKKAFGGGERRSQRNMTNEGGITVVDPEDGRVSPSVAEATTPAATATATTPFMLLGRYSNPTEIFKQTETEPTYNSIKNGDIQEIDMKEKVEAWVANLDNPSTRNLTAALMSSAPSSVSSSKKSCVFETP